MLLQSQVKRFLEEDFTSWSVLQLPFSYLHQTVMNVPAMQEAQFDPWVRKNPRRRAWQPTPAFLPGKSRRQRSLAGYSPWGHKESDTTEQLTPSSWSSISPTSSKGSSKPSHPQE